MEVIRNWNYENCSKMADRKVILRYIPFLSLLFPSESPKVLSVSSRPTKMEVATPGVALFSSSSFAILHFIQKKKVCSPLFSLFLASPPSLPLSLT